MNGSTEDINMTDNEREMVEALLKTSQIQFDLVKKLLKEDEPPRAAYYSSDKTYVSTWKDGKLVPEDSFPITSQKSA